MDRLLIYFFILVAFSCNDKNKNAHFSLEKSEKTLTFDLDAHTKNMIRALYLFTDENGKEYLTFQNRGQNDILFYDMATSKLAFRIKPDVSGNNGVGFFSGYFIKNLDSIFLTVSGAPEIAIVNKEAIVIDKISYETTIEGLQLANYNSNTAVYKPMVIFTDSLYFTPSCNRWAKFNPFAAVIDIKEHTVSALPFEYPKFPGADNTAKKAGIENGMSCCFDGENFVYSFYYEENIRVIPKDYQSMRKLSIKSKYIKKVKLLDDYGNTTLKDACENPEYGNLLYDTYRDVYYRIAYPETEIEFMGDREAMELLQYGRKNFSIVILDKNFTVIGETLFPDYTYNSTVMFIREDGLYISDSHAFNPNFSDDILSFRMFTLTKN